MSTHRPVTITDVAALAGVHVSTVSRAMNPATSHLVSAATSARVRRAAEQLGYVPNQIARSLRTASSRMIGLIVPDMGNPLFARILRGATTYLAARGFTVVVAQTSGIEDEHALLQRLTEHQVGGFIITTATMDDLLLGELPTLSGRVVMANRTIPGAVFPAVVPDDRAGVEQAVAHLAELGHRRIAHLAGPEDSSTGRLRQQAFRQACSEHGFPSGSVVTAEGYSVTQGETFGELLLSGDEPLPTAVICGNDLLAMGLLRVMRRRGLRCPEDISVVGYNDLAFSEDLSPSLTTVRVPQEELGAEAARLLVAEIAEGASPQPAKTIVLPVELMVRQSSGPPRPDAG